MFVRLFLFACFGLCYRSGGHFVQWKHNNFSLFTMEKRLCTISTLSCSFHARFVVVVFHLFQFLLQFVRLFASFFCFSSFVGSFCYFLRPFLAAVNNFISSLSSHLCACVYVWVEMDVFVNIQQLFNGRTFGRRTTISSGRLPFVKFIASPHSLTLASAIACAVHHSFQWRRSYHSFLFSISHFDFVFFDDETKNHFSRRRSLKRMNCINVFMAKMDSTVNECWTRSVDWSVVCILWTHTHIAHQQNFALPSFDWLESRT